MDRAHALLEASRSSSTAPPWVEDERSLRHRSEHGEVAIWFPSPLVIVYKYKGNTDASHARFVEETFDLAFGPNQRNIHLFVDTEHQTGYSAEFRRLTGLRAMRIQQRTDTYCLLVRSRNIAIGIHIAAVTMGAARANGLTGRLSAISNRDDFRFRIVEVVRRAAL